MSAPAIRLRRTQEERSSSTRTRLMEATIECLLELGYAGTTTTEIARRAGVSRGAQLHHFPTKAELLAAAVEHLYARRREEFAAAVAAMPDGIDRVDEAIDLLWSMFSGPTFPAWLELQVAARTDDELRPLVADLNRRAADEELAIFQQVVPLPEPDLAREALTFTFAVMNGLALQHMAPGEHTDPAAVLTTLKNVARLALPSSEGASR